MAGDGTICVYTSTAMDIVVDLEGWFGSTGALLVPQTPQRIVDTRAGLGGGRLAAGATLGHAGDDRLDRERDRHQRSRPGLRDGVPVRAPAVGVECQLRAGADRSPPWPRSAPGAAVPASRRWPPLTSSSIVWPPSSASRRRVTSVRAGVAAMAVLTAVVVVAATLIITLPGPTAPAPRPGPTSSCSATPSSPGRRPPSIRPILPAYPGTVIDAAVCRGLVVSCTASGAPSPPATGMAEIAANAGRIGDVIVVELGYNDSPSASSIDAALAALTAAGRAARAVGRAEHAEPARVRGRQRPAGGGHHSLADDATPRLGRA